jgi:hypothetical protein
MSRALIAALWIIAANLTWSNLKPELFESPAVAQGNRQPKIDGAVDCNYSGDRCVVNVVMKTAVPR